MVESSGIIEDFADVKNNNYFGVHDTKKLIGKSGSLAANMGRKNSFDRKFNLNLKSLTKDQMFYPKGVNQTADAREDDFSNYIEGEELDHQPPSPTDTEKLKLKAKKKSQAMKILHRKNKSMAY
jgi:hypothetical protein